MCSLFFFRPGHSVFFLPAVPFSLLGFQGSDFFQQFLHRRLQRRKLSRLLLDQGIQLFMDLHKLADGDVPLRRRLPVFLFFVLLLCHRSGSHFLFFFFIVRGLFLTVVIFKDAQCKRTLQYLRDHAHVLLLKVITPQPLSQILP